MNDIPITTSPEYEAVDQFQQQDLPDPHLEKTERTNYQPLQFDTTQHRDIYEELDQNTKRQKLRNARPAGPSDVYQSLGKDVIDPTYQGLYIYGNQNSQSQI